MAVRKKFKTLTQEDMNNIEKDKDLKRSFFSDVQKFFREYKERHGDYPPIINGRSVEKELCDFCHENACYVSLSDRTWQCVACMKQGTLQEYAKA